MNKEFKEFIKLAKLELKKDPSLIIIGKLNDGLKKNIQDDNYYVEEYYEFLKECDGARCGAIDFWNYDTLLKSQYKVFDMNGGEARWLCIGQVLYEPIVLNKEDGKIYMFYQGHETDMNAECLGDLDVFLNEFAFGEKYVNIIPDGESDEWYQFVKRLK